jgi:hypothetical protein
MCRMREHRLFGSHLPLRAKALIYKGFPHSSMVPFGSRSLENDSFRPQFVPN